MGKSVKSKQRQAAEAEAQFQQVFLARSRAAKEVPEAPDLLSEIQAYAAHYVRAPDAYVSKTRSGHRDKQVLALARHVFGRFRVPRVLEQAWSAYVHEPARPGQRGPFVGARANPNLQCIDFRAWYVCVATGGSLHKAYGKDWFTRRETHAFLAAPESLDLCQAVIYAVARSAGASDGLAQRLARSKLASQPFGPFWFDAVRFFAVPEQAPATLALVNDLVDYLAARRLEDRHFRVLGSGQSLAALCKRMEQWHRALARAKDLSGASWVGVDLPDHDIEQRDPDYKDQMQVWTFHQIRTGKELAEEGSAQRHCVFGYRSRCMSGACSIWSLTSTNALGTKRRHLTLEVNRYGQIVQKRGLANRLPRPDEERMVAAWAARFNLENRSVG